ncbi:hypothetical protein V1460_33575 [Streptomyces sp. SCSIO 30461]|uniref:hypothetical protein n=1 Tax=Streptomyces sp. SCSIO 30461 TaxID=3118085 RepID=UPI0030D1A0C5
MISRLGPAKRAGILAYAAAVLLLTSCSNQDKLAKVRENTVVGTWENSTGERVTLHEDHQFNTSAINWDINLGGESCPKGETAGTWGFWVDEGKPGGTVIVSTEADSGDAINLTFEGVQPGECEITLSVVDGGDTLCATDDPDLACGLDIRFNRIKPKSR